jgi:hypothetical protein
VLFFAAFLRVRFLAATIVLPTSSPSGGFGFLSVTSGERSLFPIPCARNRESSPWAGAPP